MKTTRIICAIHEALEYSEDLLKNEYLKIENRHITTGHCYVASEAIFHMNGGKERYDVYHGRDEEGTHWWLYDKLERNIVDPTKEQYTYLGEKPPYQNGKRGGFLTKKPSKRCQTLISRIRLAF